PCLRRFALEAERRRIARRDNTNRSLPFHFEQWYRHRAKCEAARVLLRLKYARQAQVRGKVGGKLFLWAVRVEVQPAELRLSIIAAQVRPAQSASSQAIRRRCD